MLKIRQSRDCLIFNMGIHILVRRHIYIETAPGFLFRKSGVCCLLHLNYTIPIYKYIIRYFKFRSGFLKCIDTTETLHERHCVSNHRQIDSLSQQFVQGNIEENIKVPHWPLWWKSVDEQWIPRAKVKSNAKVFLCHDVITEYAWIIYLFLVLFFRLYEWTSINLPAEKVFRERAFSLKIMFGLWFHMLSVYCLKLETVCRIKSGNRPYNEWLRFRFVLLALNHTRWFTCFYRTFMVRIIQNEFYIMCGVTIILNIPWCSNWGITDMKLWFLWK